MPTCTDMSSKRAKLDGEDLLVQEEECEDDDEGDEEDQLDGSLSVPSSVPSDMVRS